MNRTIRWSVYLSQLKLTSRDANLNGYFVVVQIMVELGSYIKALNVLIKKGMKSVRIKLLVLIEYLTLILLDITKNYGISLIKAGLMLLMNKRLVILNQMFTDACVSKQFANFATNVKVYNSSVNDGAKASKEWH